MINLLEFYTRLLSFLFLSLAPLLSLGVQFPLFFRNETFASFFFVLHSITRNTRIVFRYRLFVHEQQKSCGNVLREPSKYIFLCYISPSRAPIRLDTIFEVWIRQYTVSRKFGEEFQITCLFSELFFIVNIIAQFLNLII